MNQVQPDSENLGSFGGQCVLKYIQDLLEKTKYFKRS
jgi:hypothetical protein